MLRVFILMLLVACEGTIIEYEEYEHQDGQLRQEWGGQSADNEYWGLEDGITDIIPASHDRFFWYPYSGGTNDDTWDAVSLAIATLDSEVPGLRWPLGEPSDTYDQDEVLVSVSIKPTTESVPATCADADPGGCTLGIAQCLVSTPSGHYDLCHHYRVMLYWNRILVNTAARYPGDDPLDHLYDVTRHEATHVLGFEHGSGGPMASGSLPLTQCQIEILNYYRSYPSESVWTYEDKECE
jgi:hypothetical protein